MRESLSRNPNAREPRSPLEDLQARLQELRAYNEELVPRVCAQELTVAQILLASRLTKGVTALIAEYQELEAAVEDVHLFADAHQDVEGLESRVHQACQIAKQLLPQFLSLRTDKPSTLMPYLGEKSTRTH
jgi:hypothetical protein